MKLRKFFMASILVLVVSAVIGVNDFVFSEELHKSDVLLAKSDIWKILIADNVNARRLRLVIDGSPVDDGAVYMNYNGDIMLPARLAVSEFDCSMRFYDERLLVIERNQAAISIEPGESNMLLNGERLELKSEAVVKDGVLYIPMETLVKGLGCRYEWDVASNTATVYDIVSGKRYPYSFDYRAIGKATTVKNQGKFGTCWAFAALTALESSLLPEEGYDFSEDHMSLHNSFSVKQNDGGEYTMSLAYLAAWQGPVLEEDDPYGDGESPDNLSAVKHVQEVQIIEAKNFDKIKEMVYKYGAVQTSLYTSLKNSHSRSVYYNAETYAYCYIGTEKPNHDVVIIGWDDRYSKNNFNTELEADGAFICQNSWGEEFGDNGIFYVSYYDTNIGIHNVVYTGIEAADNYDKIYQSDLCGWVGQLGYMKDYAYFANAYTAGEDEELRAVSFYATGKDTEYEIYFVPNFKGSESFEYMRIVTKGRLENAGYYTVKLKDAVPLKAGEKFAVVVRIKTPDSERPIAVEYVADKSTESVELGDGEGYISLQGKVWENVEKTQNCNICLKAFTNKRETGEAK